MKSMILILISTVFLLSGGCDKEHLPQYYFKCNLNGQQYTPDNCANCTGKRILGDTILLLWGNRGFEHLGISIIDSSGIKPGVYFLNEINGRRADYKFSVTTNDRYYTDNSHVGKLTIDFLDKPNKIIEGSFYFDAFNTVQNQSVHVSEGKFRLYYDTQ